MISVLGWLCWVASVVILILLGLTVITDPSMLYWGLMLIPGGLALRSVPELPTVPPR